MIAETCALILSLKTPEATVLEASMIGSQIQNHPKSVVTPESVDF